MESLEENYVVYILTNYSETTFYVGVTSNLERRIYEHKNKFFKGFSSKYNLNKLVYFEQTSSIIAAISREKQLKNWRREWKLNLIKGFNPDFKDLSEGWLDAETSSA
jgi:putative endonuclease